MSRPANRRKLAPDGKTLLKSPIARKEMRRLGTGELIEVSAPARTGRRRSRQSLVGARRRGSTRAAARLRVIDAERARRRAKAGKTLKQRIEEAQAALERIKRGGKA